jgi:hypothetical protein
MGNEESLASGDRVDLFVTWRRPHLNQTHCINPAPESHPPARHPSKSPSAVTTLELHIAAAWSDAHPVFPPQTAAALLHGRRASALERQVIAAAVTVCAEWGGDTSTLASVFATHSGDAEAVHQLLCGIAGSPPFVSPLSFIRSVHGTVAGNWTARAGNRAPCTTVSAGPSSLGAGLLEAAVQCVAEARDVLFVFGDVRPPSPLDEASAVGDGACAAFVLSPAGRCSGRRIRLRLASAAGFQSDKLGEIRRLMDAFSNRGDAMVAVGASPHSVLLVELPAIGGLDAMAVDLVRARSA